VLFVFLKINNDKNDLALFNKTNYFKFAVLKKKARISIDINQYGKS